MPVQLYQTGNRFPRVIFDPLSLRVQSIAVITLNDCIFCVLLFKSFNFKTKNVASKYSYTKPEIGYADFSAAYLVLSTFPYRNLTLFAFVSNSPMIDRKCWKLFTDFENLSVGDFSSFRKAFEFNRKTTH